MTDINFLIHLQAVISKNVILNTYRARRFISGENSFIPPFKDLTKKRNIPGDLIRVLEFLPEEDIKIVGNSEFLTPGKAKKDSLRYNSCTILEEPKGYPNFDNILNFINFTFGRNADFSGEFSKFNYPSAGGLYNVDVFFLVREPNGWAVYHYLKNSNAAEFIHVVNQSEIVKYLSDSETAVPVFSDFIIFYTVTPLLAVAKYGERGYKFSLIEVGSMMQVASQISIKYGYRNRPYGFYDEHAISKILGLNCKHFWVEGVHLFKESNID